MIRRDGNNPSIWQKTSTPYKSLNKPDKQSIYDVIIIGGGITGVNTGLLLQRSGLNCLILEAQNLCFGTTGGTTAHINTLLDNPYSIIASNFGKENAKLVASAAKEAVSLIRNNINTYGIECEFESADAFLFSQNKQQTKDLEDIVTATKDAGLPIRYAREMPLDLKFDKVARITGQAKFHPVHYVHGLAKAFEELGGVILQQTRALSIEEKETVEVDTSKGKFLGRKIIYATHTPLGINLIHLRCQPYRTYAMAVHLQKKSYPEHLSYDMYDPYHYYRTQEINGKKFLIVGGYDHKSGQKENTEECFTELENFIRNKFEVSSVVAKWSSQYFEPADGLPYIGHLPGHSDSMYVAGGFGGNGMTYSHVAGLLLTAMIRNKKSKYQSLFSPGRIKPVAGFKNFISQNADVAKNILSKLLPNEKMPDLAQLKPGEGKVVEHENEKLAIYKSMDGEISAVNPACTHMKCTVSFNSSELSWDCPCHGARFSVTGEVLTAPANINLERHQPS